jgi:hypothetical protein
MWKENWNGMYDTGRCFAFIWVQLPWNLIWHWNFPRRPSWTISGKFNFAQSRQYEHNFGESHLLRSGRKEGMERKVFKAGTCREACRILAEQQEGAEAGQLLHDFTRPQEITLCRHLGYYSFLNSAVSFSCTTFIHIIDTVNDAARIPLGYFFPVLWIRIRIGPGFNGVPSQIQIHYPDPDPGGLKWPTKIEKS